MKKIIINISKLKSIEQFHELLKIKLGFPDYYGKNLDALWDCLTSDLETPILIQWIGYAECKNYLGNEVIKIKEVFESAQEELSDFIFEVID
jgi:ribonuclease inhibitor